MIRCPKRKRAPALLRVVQDRVSVSAPKIAPAWPKAIESALRHGQGEVQIFDADGGSASGLTLNRDKPAVAPPGELRFASAWVCPYDGTRFREPTPALFSFNNPQGACPTCRGFGRTIEIDYERALPDRRLSIKGWRGQAVAERHLAPMPKGPPQALLPRRHPDGQTLLRSRTVDARSSSFEGEREGMTFEEIEDSTTWYGVKGYFQWLETKTYKMHVRVFLSRYRAYKKLPGLPRRAFPTRDTELPSWRVSLRPDPF